MTCQVKNCHIKGLNSLRKTLAGTKGQTKVLYNVILTLFPVQMEISYILQTNKTQLEPNFDQHTLSSARE